MSDPDYVHIGSRETKLIEECSELIKILCKVDRFGWFSCHPESPDETNLSKVLAEMADVIEAINMLMSELKEKDYV